MFGLGSLLYITLRIVSCYYWCKKLNMSDDCSALFFLVLYIIVEEESFDFFFKTTVHTVL